MKVDMRRQHAAASCQLYSNRSLVVAPPQTQVWVVQRRISCDTRELMFATAASDPARHNLELVFSIECRSCSARAMVARASTDRLCGGASNGDGRAPERGVGGSVGREA